MEGGGRWGEVEGGWGEVIVRLCYCKHRLYAFLMLPSWVWRAYLTGGKIRVGGGEEADC